MKINVLLTGSTGIIGREFLYELLPKYLTGEFEGKIILLVRSKPEKTSLERVKNILSCDFRPNYLSNYNTETDFLKFIEVIDIDVADTNLTEVLKAKSYQNLYVVHMAASTNLSQSQDAEEEIYKNNYEATMNLLHSVVDFSHKFCFVSTAFSGGHREGKIENDAFEADESEFRNHYEALKNKVEKEIIATCEAHKIEWQILRPSIVCGRLLESPKFFTPKFNVFYGFGKFFSYLSQNGTQGDKIRIGINCESELNIVPVDYVAKTILRVFTDNSIKYLNIVHNYPYNNEKLVGSILKNVGFSNYEFVEEVPADLHTLEKIYYKSVGRQFTPYMLTPKHDFNTELINTIMHDVSLPVIDDVFEDVLSFAIKRNFVDLQY